MPESVRTMMRRPVHALALVVALAAPAASQTPRAGSSEFEGRAARAHERGDEARGLCVCSLERDERRAVLDLGPLVHERVAVGIRAPRAIERHERRL